MAYKQKKTIDLNKIKNIAEFEFPEADFFKPPKTKKITQSNTPTKHKAAYEAYIRWSATPKPVREPKTVREFERLWKLPQNYTTKSFRKKPDYYERKMKHFWNWVMDKYPEVLYAVYRRAIQNSTADAKIFSEIVSKRIDAVTPIKSKMTPFMLVGVPQEKINALFTPEGYEKAQDAEIVNE